MDADREPIGMGEEPECSWFLSAERNDVYDDAEESGVEQAGESGIDADDDVEMEAMDSTEFVGRRWERSVGDGGYASVFI